MSRKTRFFIAAGLVMAAGATALAHGSATGIVKERMDAMMDLGAVVKNLSAMMRGDTDYDAQTVKDGARTIRSHAGSAMTKLFPEGSAHPPSEAKPEIWSDWDGFTALANELETLAEGLEGAADNGPGMQGKSGGMMGGSSMMGGSQGMMGGGSMMMGGGRGMMDAEHLPMMPADGVFNMTTQVCSACHTRFRAEKN